MGGLWLSIILRPKIPFKSVSAITAMAGVATCNAIRDESGLKAMIKWPNDVLIGGKKVCGILTESTSAGEDISYIVVGMGINVNFELDALPSDFQGQSTSLRHELGHDVSILKLVSKLLAEFEKFYEILTQGKIDRILEDWKKLTTTLGKKVKVMDGRDVVEGIAEDIDETGALIVKDSEGKIHRLISGDCTLIHENI
jgi:BirA family biotin operon repressor/biotin-[acetyl-CoA-carboxylase] ligase